MALVKQRVNTVNMSHTVFTLHVVDELKYTNVEQWIVKLVI